MTDVNISNGTCYYAANEAAKGDWIPCGNAALVNWPCCQSGDYCLAFDDANACWDASTNNTYLAGCTDPDYQDSACPQKGTDFDSQEWVAIHICSTTGNAVEWGGCKATGTELYVVPTKSCDPYCADPIYTGASALNAFASLPVLTGKSISWLNGFDVRTLEPLTTTSTSSTETSTTPTDTSTTTGARTTATGTSTHTTESSSAASVSSFPQSTTTTKPTTSNSGLSTGIIAAIAAVGAVLVLIALTFSALFIRQRRRTHQRQSPNDDSTELPSTGYNELSAEDARFELPIEGPKELMTVETRSRTNSTTSIPNYSRRQTRRSGPRSPIFELPG